MLFKRFDDMVSEALLPKGLMNAIKIFEILAISIRESILSVSMNFGLTRGLEEAHESMKMTFKLGQSSIMLLMLEGHRPAENERRTLH